MLRISKLVLGLAAGPLTLSSVSFAQNGGGGGGPIATSFRGLLVNDAAGVVG
jgi:hypothetical protein